MSLTADRGLSSTELLQMAVDGRAGWQAVRSVVIDPEGHGATEVRTAGGSPRLELVRSKYKPGRKLSAYYRLPACQASGTAHLAVTWSGDGRVTVLRFPADPAMPQLHRLSDAGALAALLESFHGRPRTGPAPDVRVVRYQPGQRHILLARSARWRPVYAKTDRDDRGAGAVIAAGLIGGTLARRCPEARVVEPLGHSSQERTSLWWQARGQPAAVLIAHGGSAARIAWLTGCAARAIHEDCPPGAAFPFRADAVEDVRAEAAATLRAGEHIRALFPAVGRTYCRLVAAVTDELERLPAERPTVVHGDLKADNLLFDGQRLRLLDFDRARLAEPAHDLGKFLADLRWWCPAADVAGLEAAFRAGYGRCDPARWRRAELLACMWELKLAARRSDLHDSRWPELVRRRTDRAVRSFARARGR